MSNPTTTVAAAVSISLNSPAEFHYDDESRATAGTRWPVWIRDFELYLDGSGVSNAAQKKAILLHVVGKSSRDIYYTMKKDDDNYDAVKKAFSDYFAPMKNTDYEIFNFGQMKQRDSESVDDFVIRLSEYEFYSASSFKFYELIN